MNEWWMNECECENVLWINKILNVWEWIYEWIEYWMNEWMWMWEWIYEWIQWSSNEWMNEWMRMWEWIGMWKWFYEILNEWIANVRMDLNVRNEFMNEWNNKWMNVNVRTICKQRHADSACDTGMPHAVSSLKIFFTQLWWLVTSFGFRMSHLLVVIVRTLLQVILRAKITFYKFISEFLHCMLSLASLYLSLHCDYFCWTTNCKYFTEWTYSSRWCKSCVNEPS